jgi:hypothetical protein
LTCGRIHRIVVIVEKLLLTSNLALDLETQFWKQSINSVSNVDVFSKCPHSRYTSIWPSHISAHTHKVNLSICERNWYLLQQYQFAIYIDLAFTYLARLPSYQLEIT